MFAQFGEIQWDVLALLISASIAIYMFISRSLYDNRPKWLLAFLILGIFCYSGFGIAYKNIDDGYAINYIVFLLAFSVPFFVCRRIKPDSFVVDNRFDQVLLENHNHLKKVAILFLLLNLLPLLYPEFRLFNIFTFKEGNIFDVKEARSGGVILNIADNIKYLITPFFYTFFTVEQVRKPNSKTPLVFFIIFIIFVYGRYNYMGRADMMIYVIDILLLLYCVKGFRYEIKTKYIVIAFALFLSSLPFMLLFTYFRAGTTYIGDNSFLTLLNLLVESEFTYPAFYDSIAKSVDAYGTGLIDFVAYIICLPIPSAIWPGKPSYHVIENFTYFVTGMVRGDKDFYIALPSIMGESFVCGGMDFYWVFAFISGLVIATIFIYLCKKKTLTFYTFYLIVYAYTYGRGGTMGMMSLIVNGTISIFLFEQYLKMKSTRNY